MREGGYNLGGEQSGHIVMTDHVTTGDGLIAALQFLSAMVETGKPRERARPGLPGLPAGADQRPLPQGRGAARRGERPAAITAGEARMGGRGRLVIRKSGTEPLVRIMGECDDPELLRAHRRRASRPRSPASPDATREGGARVQGAGADRGLVHVWTSSQDVDFAG